MRQKKVSNSHPHVTVGFKALTDPPGGRRKSKNNNTDVMSIKVAKYVFLAPNLMHNPIPSLISKALDQKTHQKEKKLPDF